MDTARGLASLGAQVVISDPNQNRCLEIARQLRSETGNPAIFSVAADLSSQREVRMLAIRYKNTFPRLDVLINNSCGYFPKRVITVDGIEMTLALNYLSYYLLTHLLLDVLIASGPSRVINVSSSIHTWSRIDLSDLQNSLEYNGFLAYSRAKLATVLFTYELARRVKDLHISVNSLDPGLIAAGFELESKRLSSLARLKLEESDGIRDGDGVRTCLYLASAPGARGVTGKYFPKPGKAGFPAAPYDEKVAHQLWRISRQLTRVKGLI